MDLQELSKERKAIVDVTAKDDGKKVTIAGWLYDQRSLGKLCFLIIRDISGEIQVTGFKGETKPELFEAMSKTSRESAVVITGKVKKSDKAPGGREINPESYEVLGAAESPLPIDVSDFSKTELPKRLDYRFLDLHRRRTQAIFRIQTVIANAFREHFYKKEYIELQPPCIIGAASEGGTELFEVKYFEQKAYLAQSQQL